MLEIMDTTLRDGEQTSGVSFSGQEKLNIARLLLNDLGVNRIEIASARVSNGEFKTVKDIADVAITTNNIDKIEILGFIDNGESIKWIHEAGCRNINLLTKGSYSHVTEQLRKTPEQHLEDIKREIAIAQEYGIGVNIYLEDWSRGMSSSEDYVYFLMDGLRDQPIKRFMLPDTLGILNPHTTWKFCRKMINRYPELHFDFHAHNDYDLAVANTMVAVEVGVKGIHLTINGLGERAGNATMSSVIAVLHDQLKIRTSIREDQINNVSRIVEGCSGQLISSNQPIIGNNVFTQCAGIHADGDNKNNLYYNELIPERFGRQREYALGKLSGKANIRKNIDALGIQLTEEQMRIITDRVIELGDKKEIITQSDLPFIINDVIHNSTEQKIEIVRFHSSISKGLRPTATVRIRINGEEYEDTSAGKGQYHAFSKVLWKIYSKLAKPKPELVNYSVAIPPGGRTDALVQTIITWKFKEKVFKTHGLDVDQVEAAVKATEKMLNIIEDL
ncbi:alpha-isopropylmalate synthase regulatory domain-containing protein [Dysgonomonas massiliensis]|uniref:alpha-isopropylmalate synthase regulatory domain-containing protein n=1 Tax=Dysgonomonas massiliensis TaxID=2040292 RepID=UPI000C759046|nr:alpha-isopropylmalate synthase regulatory domain-containing protein [Dysgonomonas massiliensis]